MALTAQFNPQCGTHLTLHNWHLDKILFRKIAASRAQYMAYSKTQALERTKLGLDDADRKDFFYHLLHAKDPETGQQGFTPAELWGESNLLIIAGSDTTSTALAATFFYLTHSDPAILRQAASEIRSTFAAVEDIVHGAKLSSCHYLRACLDEAMRMSPPVGGALPRHILPGGLSIADTHYPAGIDICVPHYTIHHNPAYYPDPFTYDPTRWLPDLAAPGVAAFHERAQSAFCAFSIGPRGCIGRGLAYVEMMVTVARTVFLFDMRVAAGSSLGAGKEGFEEGRRREGEYQLKDTFTSMKDGPMLQFKLAVRE
jgi:cytochrome P450